MRRRAGSDRVPRPRPAGPVAREDQPITTHALPGRPRLRGVSHQIAAMVWPITGFLLFRSLTDRLAVIGTAIYVASATALFAISALYHRITWQPAARQRMRRLDHAAIFILIAGTYTPICLLTLGAEGAWLPLVIVWTGAALGVLKSLLWVGAPKWVIAVLAVVVGWAPMIEASALFAGMGPIGTTLLAGGGLLFTAGAIIYARKRPDPWPRTFGYHEVFHALVVVAAVCHLILITRLV